VVDSLAVELLLLGHMTVLTALAMKMSANSWTPADELPPNLVSLELVLGGDYHHPWAKDVSSSSSSSSSSAAIDPRGISLQPLLGLGQLQQLHLDMWCVYGDVPAAEEIAQLSTLRSLREVRIVWDSYQLGDDAAVEGIAAAFALLPGMLSTLYVPYVVRCTLYVVRWLGGSVRTPCTFLYVGTGPPGCCCCCITDASCWPMAPERYIYF
jgi:hypothetical protein